MAVPIIDPSTNAPISGYLEGAEIKNRSIGALGIHDINNSVGIESMRNPDHTVFIINSPVTSTETWEGSRGKQTEWQTGDMQFLPSDTEISAEITRPYSETAITLPDYWLRLGISQDVSYSKLDMRFTKLDGTVLRGIGAAAIALASQSIDGLPELLVESLTMTLAAAVVISLSDSARHLIANSKNGLSRERLRRVIDYIEANIYKAIGLTEIASVAALSPFHFSRSFRERMGVSPMRYVSGRRVEAARRMLATTTFSLTQIAYACGFASPSHFSTTFKSFTGRTPGDVRRASKI